MDIKLGEAKSHNKPQEHVRMSEEASRAFLKEHNISEGTTNTILSCIREHHNEWGNFSCIESEAVANADCYRFASVQGNFYFVSWLISEGMSLEDAVAFGKSKFEEKMRILSLAWCKQDLEDDIEVLTKLYS